MNYSDDDLKEIHEKIILARILAIKTAPYYRRGLLALIPVMTPGLGTFSTDKHWRMYYDPEMVDAWTLPEIAATWLHELGHQLRDHHERFHNTGDSTKHAALWNIAADAGINADLKEMGMTLPDPERRYYSDSRNPYAQWRKGLTTEELYVIVKEQEGVDDDEDDSGSSQNAQNEGHEQSGDSQLEEPSEGGTGSSDETSDGEDGSSEEKSDESSSDQGGGGPSEGNSEQEEDASSDNDSGDEGQLSPDHDMPSCGSAADNIPRPYENEDLDDGGLTESQAEKLKKEVSKDIIEYENNQRGTVPGGILREAEESMKPQVNWKNDLRKLTRKFVSFWVGQQDFSMSKVSNRSPKGIIMPGSVDLEPPIIVIVIDTSGSMSKRDLGVAIAEIKSILKRISSRSKTSVTIINCDSQSHEALEVTDINKIDIVGGGGTDMRVGIKAAAELKPTPNLIVTITDGGTPWPVSPDDKAPKARYIALVTVAGNLSEKEKDSYNIPSFITPIFANTSLKLR